MRSGLATEVWMEGAYSLLLIRLIQFHTLHLSKPSIAAYHQLQLQVSFIAMHPLYIFLANV